jgi:ornithine decarboxylase
MSKATSGIFDADFLETFRKETPYFLFSKEQVEAKIKEFAAKFPGAEIEYAMKANSEPEILKIINDFGCGFEVASAHELALLKEINVAPEKIVYGTSVKPLAHIREFAEYGVDRFAFDSFPELEKIAAVAPKARVYVRARVNDTGSVFKLNEKFGTEVSNIVPLLERARDLGLTPYGISFHVGSQASNVRAWAEAVQQLQASIEHLKSIGIIIPVLNIGGGYPCNSYASSENQLELQDIADGFYEEYRKLSFQPQILIEPGRGIVAETGILVASVIGRVDRQEHTWLFLDAGVYSGLFESMAYQGSTRYKITSLRGVGDAGESMFALAGPTGDSPDVITREALLPADVSVGDKLIIHDVGAYGLPAVCPFNGFPKPAVYTV